MIFTDEDFRKQFQDYEPRPQWIRAFQWHGFVPPGWTPRQDTGLRISYSHGSGPNSLHVKTDAGEVEVIPGHWIIHEQPRLFRVLPPQDFLRLYQPARPLREEPSADEADEEGGA